MAWRQDLGDFLRAEFGHFVHPIHGYDTGTSSNAAPSGADAKAKPRATLGELKADPARFEEFHSVIRPIIRRDLRLVLEETDYVIALWDSYVLGGAGTHGEITLAHYFGIPIHLVLGMPRREASGWILGCADEVHESFDALKARLRVLVAQGALRRRGEVGE